MVSLVFWHGAPFGQLPINNGIPTLNLALISLGVYINPLGVL